MAVALICGDRLVHAGLPPLATATFGAPRVGHSAADCDNARERLVSRRRRGDQLAATRCATAH